jgi:hypothetical protein
MEEVRGYFHSVNLDNKEHLFVFISRTATLLDTFHSFLSAENPIESTIPPYLSWSYRLFLPCRYDQSRPSKTIRWFTFKRRCRPLQRLSGAAWLLLFSYVYWSPSVFHIPRLQRSQLPSHTTSQSELAKYVQNSFQAGTFLQSGSQRLATITRMSARFACESGCTTVSRFREKVKFDVQLVRSY